MSGVRQWQVLLAVLGLSLPVLPLLGLAWGALEPPPTLFPGQGASSWSSLVVRRGPSGGLGPLPQSALLALCVASLALPIGAALAWLERRAEYRGARVLGALTLVPLVIPSYILAGTLRQTLGPGGLVGGALDLPSFTGFWPAVLVLTLATAPYAQLLIAAGLARCPASEEEAARTLGASPWRAFRAAVLPRLRPALAASFLLVQLYVISDFGAVAVLDCQVLTWRLYQTVQTARFDQALALGAAVLLLCAPLLAGARWIQGSAGDRAGPASQRSAARVRLSGAVLAGALALQLLVVGLGAAVPVLSLVGWVLDGVRRGLPFADVSTPLLHTAWAAGLGALFTVALALAPAWVAARSAGRGARALEHAALAASALPGVLLAFGLLLAALALARATTGAAAYQWLLGSGLLLLIGYATRFLAQAFAAVRAGVLGLDPQQDECARALGAGAWRRTTRVTGPQLIPSLAAAWVLVFLATVKELPVTLLLGGPLGLSTLSFRVYDRYQEALLHDAGLAGLVIVGLALAASLVSARWRRHE